MRRRNRFERALIDLHGEGVVEIKPRQVWSQPRPYRPPLYQLVAIGLVSLAGIVIFGTLLVGALIIAYDVFGAFVTT